jgi:L-threonylcarbamoyladenylate synthase
MKTRIIKISDPTAVDHALDVLRAGGLIAFPTDTVYGLAADLHQPDAIQKLYEVKGRDAGKAIAVLVGRPDHVDLVSAGMTEAAARLAARFWPGGLTLVLPKRPGLPENLSPLPTIGVRMPDHPFALALLRAAGPLAVTSANLSGQASPQTAEEVLAQLEGKLDLLLDGGRCPGGVPSTVVDCAGADLRILRQGAIPAEEILGRVA